MSVLISLTDAVDSAYPRWALTRNTCHSSTAQRKELSAAGYTQFFIGAFAVGDHAADSDIQLRRDRLVLFTPQYRPTDLLLAVGQEGQGAFQTQLFVQCEMLTQQNADQRAQVGGELGAVEAAIKAGTAAVEVDVVVSGVAAADDRQLIQKTGGFEKRLAVVQPHIAADTVESDHLYIARFDRFQNIEIGVLKIMALSDVGFGQFAGRGLPGIVFVEKGRNLLAIKREENHALLSPELIVQPL